MSELTEHTAGGSTFQIRRIQALDGDPLFHDPQYTFAVDGADAAFEIHVEMSVYYVHLLTLRERTRLEASARDLVGRLLDAGVRHAARLTVSADGAALVDGILLATLLPLTKPTPPPKAAAHG